MMVIKIRWYFNLNNVLIKNILQNYILINKTLILINSKV